MTAQSGAGQSRPGADPEQIRSRPGADPSRPEQARIRPEQARADPEQTGAGWSRREQAGADPTRPEQAGQRGAGAVVRPCAAATTWDTPCSIPGATRAMRAYLGHEISRRAPPRSPPRPRRDLDGPRPAARGGCRPHTIGLELLARLALSSAKSRAGRLGHTHIDPAVAAWRCASRSHNSVACHRYRPRTTEPRRGSGKDPKMAPESVAASAWFRNCMVAGAGRTSRE